MRFSNDIQQGSPYRRVAVFLIAAGACFALDSYFQLHFVYKLWPLLVTILSIGFLGIFFKGNSRVIAYLALGVYLFCVSGLSLYCNFTSWERIGRLWPLFISFLGFVFIAFFIFGKKRRFHLLFGCILVSLSVVFFLVFAWGAQLWWTVLLLLGISILITEKVK